MAGMDMKVLLESIAGQLQPSDIEELKYILKDSFTGMFHSNPSALERKFIACLRIFNYGTVLWVPFCAV